MADHDDLLTSPLHAAHQELGAKFAAFGGWSMPLEYPGGVVAEHRAVREAVGLFDVSHLGKAGVTGPGAAAFVDRCLTNALDRIGPGQAQYTLCCREDGGVVDDLIVYLRGDDDVLLVPNAANTAEVVRLLAEAAPEGVVVRDRHTELAVLAVQGPRSPEVLRAAGLPTEHDYMAFAEVELDGAPIVVCRTGYTGELGYELLVPFAAAPAVWSRLLEAGAEHGIVPAGLGARDTLRTEMGYPLHGQDIGPTITPVQARLAWAVGWDKPAFWGRDALARERAEKPARVLRGLRATGRGIPRPGMRVERDGRPVGEITSGTFSPTLKTGVGLALLERGVAEGDVVQVDVRGRAQEFEVVRPPFVEASTR